MARPTKWRKIENVPAIAYFVPSDKEGPEVSENILKLEELEAIRLKDLEGLEQGEYGGYVCPACGSKKVTCGQTCKGKFRCGNCWRHGRMDR